jgi:pimeloyl-ACP methyl ester carboxylesterase
MITWEKNYGFLVNNGFKVLRYNYFGRGLSDRPDLDYDLDTYVQQLEQLLEGLNLKGPMHIVGHSFGCVVAAEYAQRHKESIKSITLVSPAGFKLETNPAAKLLNVPILGDYMMRLMGDGMLLSHNKQYFLDHKKHKLLIKSYIAQSKIKGFKRVQKATFLNAPLQTYEQGYAGLGESNLPVKIIWARQDLTFPFSHSETARKLIPQATLVPIEEARHVPQYEQPDDVNAALLQWLTSGS